MSLSFSSRWSMNRRDVLKLLGLAPLLPYLKPELPQLPRHTKWNGAGDVWDSQDGENWEQTQAAPKPGIVYLMMAGQAVTATGAIIQPYADNFSWEIKLRTPHSLVVPAFELTDFE